MQKIQNTFETTSISLAASLLTSGRITLIKAIELAPLKYIYVFRPKNICEEFQRQYFNNELVLPIRRVEENVRLLKSITPERRYKNEYSR